MHGNSIEVERCRHGLGFAACVDPDTAGTANKGLRYLLFYGRMVTVYGARKKILKG